MFNTTNIKKEKSSDIGNEKETSKCPTLRKKKVYKKDRKVAKALLGAFSHVRVSLNIKQIEIFKMADIGKRIQRENYQP